ncbi:hypothetical protein C3747_46g31 [Trypanosoma cruzi]|uniref:Uncharacterized protein n=2 Tax=Trypanosoma cruzi TaxID=5693 RepID=Q4D6G8_TRYCC|nr:hypothetical protein, conserved [Trypanosoma cruzi]EAN88118.1 hypothetical protein, conserved [Trypanosoma cruzi]PWV13006.1 hypothetical protein C3747_46g31 [Trypanosoma cruzi]RNC55685.1 hypothetical protein TcCL_ESM06800 [Trypanosoma cruzi]|eukprot:XP_809969.1 hypothetical protein [Trypanosoma cruzi strain CL Brener]
MPRKRSKRSGRGTEQTNPPQPPVKSNIPFNDPTGSLKDREPQLLSPQTLIASEFLENPISSSTHCSEIGTPSSSVPTLAMVKYLLQQAAEDEESDNTAGRMILIREESALRSIIENDASMEHHAMMKALYGRSPLSSVCGSVNSWSASSRRVHSVESETRAMKPCGLWKQQEDTEVPLAKTAALPMSGSNCGVQVTSRLQDLQEEEEEEEKGSEQVLSRRFNLVPSYGTMEGLQGDANSHLGDVNSREVSSNPLFFNFVTGEEGRTIAWVLYENELPVFKIVDDSDSDFTVEIEKETKGLLRMDVNFWGFFRAMARQVLFLILSVGIFFPSMAQSGLFASMDLLTNVEGSVTRRNMMKLTLLFVDAAAIFILMPLIAFCFRGGNSIRFILLFTATITTVGSGICLMRGYTSGSFELMMISQLLHAVGLVLSVIMMLFINCAKMGAFLGTISLMFITIYLWLMSFAAGIFIFLITLRLSEGEVLEVLRGFVYLTCVGPIFALAICLLPPPPPPPPTDCQGTTRISYSAIDAGTMFATLRRVEFCFLLRCMACGCLLAVLFLIIEFESLLSSKLFAFTSPPFLAYLLLFTVIVALPLCLLPRFGPFVRLCEFGLLTSLAAVSLFGLMFTNIPSEVVTSLTPFSLPWMPAMTAILCASSLAVVLAGLMRSLASVKMALPLVVVPAFLLTTLLSLCVALATGVAAVVLEFRLQSGNKTEGMTRSGANDTGETQAGQAVCVGHVAFGMCVGALFLQFITAARTFFAPNFK